MRAFFFFSGMEAQSDEVEEEYCWAIAQAAERSSRGRLISRFSESGLQLDSPVYTTYSWHAVGLPCVHYIQLTLSWTPLCTLHTADTQFRRKQNAICDRPDRNYCVNSGTVPR